MRKVLLGMCLSSLLLSIAPAIAAEDVSGASTIGGPATKHHSGHMHKHKKKMMMKKHS